MKKTFFILNLLLVSFCVTAQTGIGTTTPINKLDIFTAKSDPATTGSLSNGNLRLGAIGSNTHILDFGLSSTSTFSWIQARDKANYSTNYILALNPNGGYVGINKIAPSKALDVTGDVGVSGNLSGGNTTASTLSGFAANFNNIITGSTYSLLASDNGKIISINVSSAFSLTIPTGLPVGFNCTIVQYGSGQITLLNSGTTLKNRNNYNKSAGQYSIITIVNMGSETYITSGEMSN